MAAQPRKLPQFSHGPLPRPSPECAVQAACRRLPHVSTEAVGAWKTHLRRRLAVVLLPSPEFRPTPGVPVRAAGILRTSRPSGSNPSGSRGCSVTFSLPTSRGASLDSRRAVAGAMAPSSSSHLPGLSTFRDSLWSRYRVFLKLRSSRSLMILRCTLSCANFRRLPCAVGGWPSHTRSAGCAPALKSPDDNLLAPSWLQIRQPGPDAAPTPASPPIP